MDLIALIGRIISESTQVDPNEFAPDVAAFASELRARVAQDSELQAIDRAGHAQIGMLFTTLQEDIAIQASVQHEPEHDKSLHAWIEALGAAIIGSSSSQLTPFAREVAELWPTVPAHIQVLLARAAVRDIMFALSDPAVSKCEGESNESSDQDMAIPTVTPRPAPLGLEWLADIERTYDIRSSQPSNFGNSRQGKIKPNCLGVGMIMAAFALATGSPTMLGSRQRQMSAELEQLHSQMGAQLLELFGDEVPKQFDDFFDKLTDRRHRFESSVMRIEDFHASIVVQLADGNWLHLDPYLEDFAVYTSPWELTETHRLLNQYAPAVPGLALVVTDEGAFDAFTKLWRERLSILNDLIRNFPGEDAPIVGSSSSIIAAVDGLESSFFHLSQFDATRQIEIDELNLWLAELVWSIGGQVNLDTADGLIVEYLYDLPDRYYEMPDKAMGLELMKDLFISRNIQFAYDPEFRREFYRTFRGLCLQFFDELWRTDWFRISDNYVYACPQLECSRPTYGLALALLNQYACWTNDGVPASVLLGLGSSPMWWHEALDLSQGEIPVSPELTWSEAMLRELPLHHPRVQLKLTLLDSRRARS